MGLGPPVSNCLVERVKNVDLGSTQVQSQNLEQGGACRLCRFSKLLWQVTAHQLWELLLYRLTVSLSRWQMVLSSVGTEFYSVFPRTREMGAGVGGERRYSKAHIHRAFRGSRLAWGFPETKLTGAQERPVT